LPNKEQYTIPFNRNTLKWSGGYYT
jgi:hypothetical protein